MLGVCVCVHRHYFLWTGNYNGIWHSIWFVLVLKFSILYTNSDVHSWDGERNGKYRDIKLVCFAIKTHLIIKWTGFLSINRIEQLKSVLNICWNSLIKSQIKNVFSCFAIKWVHSLLEIVFQYINIYLLINTKELYEEEKGNILLCVLQGLYQNYTNIN